MIFMSEPLVSVIVPTFNRAYCVPASIDSALQQTHKNVEVIVIDDGSTDNTAELIRSKYGTEDRVKYLHQKNQGVHTARNTGMDSARGDFLAYLDSDDIWEPWKLEVQIACMSRFPELGMTWTDMRAVNPQGVKTHDLYLSQMYSCYRKFELDQIFPRSYSLGDLAPNAPDDVKKGRLLAGDIFKYMFMGSLVHTSTVVLTRERFKKVGHFDKSMVVLGEDYDIHLRTCEIGDVGLLTVPTIDYQTGMPDRLTAKPNILYAANSCLRTMAMAMERSGARINFPARKINERYAEVHAWYGETLLDCGRRKEARKELLRSLTFRPWQPRTMRLLALAMTPKTIGDFARSRYQRAKGKRESSLATSGA
jgi:glycosyltransferase involved in cell wall biosynthesis